MRLETLNSERKANSIPLLARLLSGLQPRPSSPSPSPPFATPPRHPSFQFQQASPVAKLMAGAAALPALVAAHPAFALVR